jgi:hypothetical protein
VTLTFTDLGEDIWLIREVADHEGDKSRGGTVRSDDKTHHVVNNIFYCEGMRTLGT